MLTKGENEKKLFSHHDACLSKNVVNNAQPHPNASQFHHKIIVIASSQ